MVAKTVLLKPTQDLTTRYRESKLWLGWKPPLLSPPTPTGQPDAASGGLLLPPGTNTDWPGRVRALDSGEKPTSVLRLDATERNSLLMLYPGQSL